MLSSYFNQSRNFSEGMVFAGISFVFGETSFLIHLSSE